MTWTGWSHTILAPWVVAAGFAAAALTNAGAQVPGELRGRVTDASTLQPIADASVEVIGASQGAKTGPDGAFIVRGLEPREYVVRVRALGYAARAENARLENGRSTTIAIALEPTVAAIRGMLVRAERDTPPLHALTFDRTAIESSGRRDLGELLRTTPGVVVTQAGGAGAETRVSIRGSSASEVLVLVDGVPVNSSISGAVDLSRIPLESVERITVLTGAQSARYGARALAGVIEVETRRATGEQAALLRGGAWGEREVSATVSGRHPAGARQVSASIIGDYRGVDGDFPIELPALRGGGFATRVNSDMASRQLLAALSLDDDAGHTGIRAAWESLGRGLAGSIIQPSSTGRETNARVSGGMNAARQQGVLSWTALADVSRERATFTDASPPFGTAYHDTAMATGLTASSTATVGDAMQSASLGAELRTLDVTSTMLAAGSPHWQRLLGVFGAARTSRVLAEEGLTVSLDAAARIDNSSLDGSSAFSPRIGASASRGAVTASFSVGNGFSPPTLACWFARTLRSGPSAPLATSKVESPFERSTSVRSPYRRRPPHIAPTSTG